MNTLVTLVTFGLFIIFLYFILGGMSYNTNSFTFAIIEGILHTLRYNLLKATWTFLNMILNNDTISVGLFIYSTLPFIVCRKEQFSVVVLWSFLAFFFLTWLFSWHVSRCPPNLFLWDDDMSTIACVVLLSMTLTCFRLPWWAILYHFLI